MPPKAKKGRLGVHGRKPSKRGTYNTVVRNKKRVLQNKDLNVQQHVWAAAGFKKFCPNTSQQVRAVTQRVSTMSLQSQGTPSPVTPTAQQMSHNDVFNRRLPKSKSAPSTTARDRTISDLVITDLDLDSSTNQPFDSSQRFDMTDDIENEDSGEALTSQNSDVDFLSRRDDASDWTRGRKNKKKGVLDMSRSNSFKGIGGSNSMRDPVNTDQVSRGRVGQDGSFDIPNRRTGGASLSSNGFTFEDSVSPRNLKNAFGSSSSPRNEPSSSAERVVSEDSRFAFPSQPSQSPPRGHSRALVAPGKPKGRRDLPPTHSSQYGCLSNSNSLGMCSQFSQVTPADQPVKDRSAAQLTEQLARNRETKGGSDDEGAPQSSYRIRPNNLNYFLPKPPVQERKATESQNKHSTNPEFRLSQSTNSLFTANFTTLKELGQGSFGVVVKCRSKIDGALYAVKRIRKPIKGEKQQQDMFREVFALSALHHPNIVTYHSAWLEEDKKCSYLNIQLEFLQGDNLSKYPQRKQALSEKHVLTVALAMGKALQYMHRKGIAHMDIKPENILMVDGFGDAHMTDPSSYKIADFGLATKMASEPVSVGLVGDNRYLPEEALEDRIGSLDKVDMFSLGASLYELARGVELPKRGIEWASIRSGDIELNPSDYSEFMVLLIRQLLHRNPDDRYSADYLVKLIEQRQKDALLVELESLRAQLKNAQSRLSDSSLHMGQW